MQRFAKRPLKEAIRAAKGNVRAHLRANTELQFVYDVCEVVTPFNDLRYILDAGRAPLEELDEDSFLRTYGLARTLRFQDSARRARAPSDWWGSVYDP